MSFFDAGKVERGLPPLAPPPFSAPGPGNETLAFTDMVSSYGGGLLVLPVVGVLANIAIAKSFCEWSAARSSPCRWSRLVTEMSWTLTGRLARLL